MTQTTSANWTALNAGSTTGQTLGIAGNTLYLLGGGTVNATGGNAANGGSGGAGYWYDDGKQDDEQDGTDGTSQNS